MKVWVKLEDIWETEKKTEKNTENDIVVSWNEKNHKGKKKVFKILRDLLTNKIAIKDWQNKYK